MGIVCGLAGRRASCASTRLATPLEASPTALGATGGFGASGAAGRRYPLATGTVTAFLRSAFGPPAWSFAVCVLLSAPAAWAPAFLLAPPSFAVAAAASVATRSTLLPLTLFLLFDLPLNLSLLSRRLFEFFPALARLFLGFLALLLFLLLAFSLGGFPFLARLGFSGALRSVALVFELLQLLPNGPKFPNGLVEALFLFLGVNLKRLQDFFTGRDFGVELPLLFGHQRLFLLQHLSDVRVLEGRHAREALLLGELFRVFFRAGFERGCSQRRDALVAFLCYRLKVRRQAFLLDGSHRPCRVIKRAEFAFELHFHAFGLLCRLLLLLLGLFHEFALLFGLGRSRLRFAEHLVEPLALLVGGKLGLLGLALAPLDLLDRLFLLLLALLLALLDGLVAVEHSFVLGSGVGPRGREHALARGAAARLSTLSVVRKWSDDAHDPAERGGEVAELVVHLVAFGLDLDELDDLFVVVESNREQAFADRLQDQPLHVEL